MKIKTSSYEKWPCKIERKFAALHTQNIYTSFHAKKSLNELTSQEKAGHSVSRSKSYMDL
jgi:hypothetical protein